MNENKKQYGVCLLSSIPMRNAADNTAEMTTQMLFGEVCTILDDTLEFWYKVLSTNQLYTGWVCKTQIMQIAESEWQLLSNPTVFAGDDCILHGVGTNEKIRLPIGSPLPIRPAERTCSIAGKQWAITGKIIIPEQTVESLLKYLNVFISTPYLWGGMTQAGIDCSGLVHMTFRLVGIQTPRDASQQVTHGTDVIMQDPLPGDVAFFKNDNGHIVHVGVVVELGKIIHASMKTNGCVAIDVFDEKGIKTVHGTYSHTLAIIKRFI